MSPFVICGLLVIGTIAVGAVSSLLWLAISRPPTWYEDLPPKYWNDDEE